MAGPDNINNFDRTISEAEFNQLLNSSVIEAKQKPLINSIFSKISQWDGEDGLSAEDWETFIDSVDKNQDGNLEDTEFKTARNNRKNKLFGLSKKDLINFYNMVKRYIENKYSTVVTRADGTQEVFFAYEDASTSANRFDTGWIESDAAGSTTYEEWLKNNGYEVDYDAAERLYKKTSRLHNSKKNLTEHIYYGNCAMVYRKAAQAKEVDLFEGMVQQGSAYKYASELVNNPNYKELPHNIVMNMDLSKLPRGCIIVYDVGYKSGSHPNGHIGITAGDGYEYGGGCYKDQIHKVGYQPLMKIADDKQETHIRVFIPIKPKQETIEPIAELESIKPFTLE